MILIVRQSLDQIHLLINHLKVYVGNIEECNIESAKIDMKNRQLLRYFHVPKIILSMEKKISEDLWTRVHKRSISLLARDIFLEDKNLTSNSSR